MNSRFSAFFLVEFICFFSGYFCLDLFDFLSAGSSGKFIVSECKDSPVMHWTGGGLNEILINYLYDIDGGQHGGMPSTRSAF